MFRADPIPFGPFTKGVNNRLPDMALLRDQLRNAVNVDLDNSGHLHRRQGAVSAVAGATVRSAWAEGDSGYVYFADGTSLKRFTPDGTPPFAASVVATVTAGASLAYERYLGQVFWSDGKLTGQIVNGVNQAWGIAPAAAAPTLAQTTGGLYDGQYQATYTYVRASGEESGAPMTSEITISHSDRTQDGTAGIVIGGIVASTDPTVVGINVYCTGANGTVPYRVGTLPNAAGNLTVQAIDTVAGQQLATQFFTPPPAGIIIFAHGSRIYAVLGNFLFYSERFAPGWFAPASNFLPFGAPVAVALPVKDGIYVATSEETYFLSGIDPAGTEFRERMRMSRVLSYGAVQGSGVVVRNGERVAWMGKRGIVIAGPGGDLKAVQEEQVAVELATRGVTGYREVNGIRQLVAVLFDGQVSPMANRDFVAQEAKRLATVLPTE